VQVSINQPLTINFIGKSVFFARRKSIAAGFSASKSVAQRDHTDFYPQLGLFSDVRFLEAFSRG
jgi:hypothetical protein